MSSFVALQAPPGSALKVYDRHQRHSSQPAAEHLPPTFLDAMSVREDVYVDEQSVPLENEMDDDDARSLHWVVYASVATNGSPDRHRKGSAAGQLPVGTIRLVLPPHDHEVAGHNERPNMNGPESGQDPSAVGCLRRASEPYVRMSRLAVLKPYRKMGLSSLLVNAALEHVANHPDEVMPPMSPTATEHRRMETGQSPSSDDQGEWDGLVLVHAQGAIEKLWSAWGFVRDHTMGEWDEEGIMHVGMWRRLTVVRRRPSVIGSGMSN